MSDENKVINLADRRPVEAPKVVEDLSTSFSIETQSDDLANKLVAGMMVAMSKYDIMVEDENEIRGLYGAIANITDRHFGVVKEVPDGEDS